MKKAKEWAKVKTEQLFALSTLEREVNPSGKELAIILNDFKKGTRSVAKAHSWAGTAPPIQWRTAYTSKKSVSAYTSKKSVSVKTKNKRLQK